MLLLTGNANVGNKTENFKKGFLYSLKVSNSDDQQFVVSTIDTDYRHLITNQNIWLQNATLKQREQTNLTGIGN